MIRLEEAKWIKKETFPTQLSTSADRITLVVGAERQVPAPMLCDVFREDTTCATLELQRQVESLMS